MSEPEIARRCPSCGVSLRQRALYCPQCGQHIGDSEPVETSQTAPTQALHSVTHSSALTSVAGNVRERVEKIKHVSTVMIDQAAYDPSLRFLLVAAVIFVLFLILLILSKVIS
jgi:uncharacterized Zn finger protein (UPF0148 family)